MQSRVNSVLLCPTSPLSAAPRSRAGQPWQGWNSRLQEQAQGSHCTLLLQQPCSAGEALPLNKRKVLTSQNGYKQFHIIVDVWKRCKTSDTIRFILRSIKNHPVKKQARLLEEEVEEAF